MENLSTLEKIYQYGETLSSEEMNQIVSYVNNTIDAVNALIRNNNGINSGHCELRYKNSSSQPQKPTTGSNGLTNGWSNTYSLPDTSQGETAWMTICFVTGENVYGEWSTPVCISWGSVTGQQGPPGQTGTRGSFISRIFKRTNTKPDTPTGGTYDNPVPNGWYDGVPDGVAIIWSSTCTFYGNGTKTEWSDPAQESDTNTLDIEFSPSIIKPNAPLGNRPFQNHEIEGWYDPSSLNFNSVGPMIWRAERKVSNGEYKGNWTITRIFGEKGDQGLPGEAGGHLEIRYKNYKPTQEIPVPTKPETGTEGTSNGWNRTQETLSELQIKEGIFTWMTQCFVNSGLYGTWTTPIRITGANGIDGKDGTDYEFIYTRNNTGNTPDTPPTIQKSKESLFNDFGQWEEPVHHVLWTNKPLGVDDEHMWEYVSTRTKYDGLWSAWTTPVVWAKWGKQGKIGPMSYLAGVWASNVTYTKTAEKNPIVYHNNNYYYLKGEINNSNSTITSIGQNPTGTYTDENPNPWAQAENYETVFTDILFVNEFAKLNSFIITHDWMISKNGTLYYRSGSTTTSYDVDESHNPTINGTTYTSNDAYTQFDPNCPNVANSSNTHKNPNFVPAIAIDSLSGRCFFWKGKFTGDVYANTLHVGNNDMTTLPSTLSTMNTNINKKLEATDVQVLSDGVNKQIKVGNNTYNIIDDGDFLLSNVGVTGDGYYFKVDKKGLLEAHNAIIYGTISATGGRFSGDVYADTFRAGNPGGLNITVTGDSINFNKGTTTCAWFSTVDPNGTDSNSLYLYIKHPTTGSVYTLDFSNLTVVGGGNARATQQTTYYTNITDSNYKPNLFTSSADSYYYSDSSLSNLYSGTLYQKVKTGWAIIYNTSNSKYIAQQGVDFFKKVVFSGGSITSTSSEYWASANVNGNLVRIYGTSSTAPSSNQIEGLGSGNISFSNSNVYYATTSPSSGGKITRCEIVATQYSVSLVGKEALDMSSV